MGLQFIPKQLHKSTKMKDKRNRGSGYTNAREQNIKKSTESNRGDKTTWPKVSKYLPKVRKVAEPMWFPFYILSIDKEKEQELNCLSTTETSVSAAIVHNFLHIDTAANRF